MKRMWRRFGLVTRVAAALLGAFVASLVLTAVVARAWVAEDAFITLRYVVNTVEGRGMVFNPGERVHGFTHPLWFLLLLLGCVTRADPILVAAGGGMILTLVFVAVLAWYTIRMATKPLQGILAFCAVATILLCSETWTSFQTGGLENSLTGLIITLLMAEVVLRGFGHVFRIGLFSGLLVLARLDLVLLGLPVCFTVMVRLRKWRSAFAFLAGLLPALIWLVVAWFYYGTPIPNPAYAKLGIYGTLREAAGQGLLYLCDWFVRDPAASWGSVLFLCFVLLEGRERRRIVPLLGIGLYLTWVVSIGGDFMRGRLLTPMFTACAVLAAITAARGAVCPVARRRGYGLLYPLTFFGILIAGIAVKDDGNISAAGIVNERKYYPGYRLAFYLRHGRLENPHYPLEIAEELKRYAEHCGEVAVHFRSPGTLGYLAGPKVQVIDTLGLTDRFIARLPRRLLREPHPRPGHPDKFIPISYLAKRGDIAILAGWREAVEQLDCLFRERLRPLEHSRDFLDPWMLIE
ncbi:MAG: hypothetical protein ACUVWX_09385 [Kiritimatiellia bacterium]